MCNAEGRFLMNDVEMDRVGRIIAGILRHFPERYEIEMSPQGWVSVHELVKAVKKRDKRFRWLKPHHIFAMVETDEKGRYQIRDDNVRATYGHSLSLELDLPTSDIPDLLYYPATPEEVELMLENGIAPSDRDMVHLSSTYDKAKTAGLHRVSNPVILEVDTVAAREDGMVIMKACDSVYLTKIVDAEFVRLCPGEVIPEIEATPEEDSGDAGSVEDDSGDDSGETLEEDEVSKE